VANKVSIDLELKGEKLVERGLQNVGDAADKAGDGLAGMAKDSGVLTKKIAETKAEVQRLIKTFNETGDLDLLKSIRKEQSNLRLFERLRKTITQEAAEAGQEAGITISQSLTKAMMASRGLIIPPLVAIGAMVAPVLGAAISSAIVGAAGTGGLVGGIVAASQDQRVQEAAKQVGDRIGGSLTEAGAVFVGPVIESLRILDDAGDRLADNFGKAGAKIAPVLPALAGGISGFADAVGPGFIRAMDSAKPVIRAISSELPKIGDAVSDFFDKISDDPDQAVMGIVAISQAIQSTIDAAGSLLSTLGDIFEWSSRTGASMADTIDSLLGWLPIQGDYVRDITGGWREQVAAIDAASDSTDDFSGGLGGIIRAEEEVESVTKSATEAIDAQISAMDKMFGRFMNSREVARNYQEAIDDLNESVAKNGPTLDIGTEAGRENAEMLDKLSEAIKEAREDTIRNTGDVYAANEAYFRQVEALRQQAIKLGMSRQAADELAAALINAAKNAEIEVRAPGLLEALERARELNRLMGNISAGARARAGDTSGYGGGRAGGGRMDAGKWYTVGENGVEVVSMDSDGGGAMVYNNKQTQAMVSGASGGASAAVAIPVRPLVHITAAPSGNAAFDALIQALWPHILKQVQVDGGDLAAFGAA
jgi:tetratricopeptide (TPR) repeat protein